jgi:hypothetical protein
MNKSHINNSSKGVNYVLIRFISGDLRSNILEKFGEECDLEQLVRGNELESLYPAILERGRRGDIGSCSTSELKYPFQTGHVNFRKPIGEGV